MKNGILQLRLAFVGQFSELLPKGARFKFDSALNVLEEEIDNHIAQSRAQGHEEQRLAVFIDELKEEDPSP